MFKSEYKIKTILNVQSITIFGNHFVSNGAKGGKRGCRQLSCTLLTLQPG